jgi:hypothetical protein
MCPFVIGGGEKVDGGVLGIVEGGKSRDVGLLLFGEKGERWQSDGGMGGMIQKEMGKM